MLNLRYYNISNKLLTNICLSSIGLLSGVVYMNSRNNLENISTISNVSLISGILVITTTSIILIDHIMNKS